MLTGATPGPDRARFETAATVAAPGLIIAMSAKWNLLQGYQRGTPIRRYIPRRFATIIKVNGLRPIKLVGVLAVAP